jgi:membrane fusion protein, copper/silver efflux system
MKRKILFLIAVAVISLAGAGTFIGCQSKGGSAAKHQVKIVYHCPMHPAYLSDKPGTCPICGMNLVPVEGNEAPTTAVYIDPAMVQTMNVQTEKAARRSISPAVRTSAVIKADERGIVVVSSRVTGYIEKLHANVTGQRVAKGQPLFEIYSPDLVSAQSEYLQALKGAHAPGDTGLVAGARARLLNWGVPQSEIAAIESSGAPGKAITIVSPANGILTEKMVVEGQSVEPGMKLFTIVDFSRVWAMGDVYQQDAPTIALGQKADVTLDFLPGLIFSGRVSFIDPQLNADSRTLGVRVELANTSDLKLKPGMNATMVFHVPAALPVIAVPDQAVIRSGLRNLVIVSEGKGYFEPREVATGLSANGYTEIHTGVAEGDEIVVSSQFLIDAESNLRAAVQQLGGIKTGRDSLEKR